MLNEPTRSTRETGSLLKIPPSRLTLAIWDNRFAPPKKDSSGRYVWTDADIRRAAHVLLKRDVSDLLDGQGVENE